MSEQTETVKEQPPIDELIAQGRARELPDSLPDESAEPAPTEAVTAEPEPETSEPETETAEPEPSPTVPLAAQLEERSKRQVAEAEARFLREQMQNLQTQKPTEAPKPLTADEFLDNPGLLEDRFSKLLDERTAAIRTEFQQKTWATQEAAAKSRYEDYGEMVTAFQNAAQSNPHLLAEMQSSADAAEFAYQKGRDHSLIQKHGSLQGLLADVEAKTMAKAEKMLQEKLAKLPNVPDSEISAPSLNPQTGGNAQRGNSIEDILGRARRERNGNRR